ncbi:MAG: type II toxin-antitoxin system RelE/ParE family toxin [Chloroflexi bacterium]|nr:type II toxin-antitoxin system RelE/ParE family toxin [Chloroflexota bacterium]
MLPRAQRQLRALPPSAGARVRPRIVDLAADPRPTDARRLRDEDLWRIRIADLRVIYRIDDAARVVSITRVARRSESTYRRL